MNRSVPDRVKHYDPEFFHGQRDGSLRSANAVLPIVLERVNINTAVDVGCGVGTWTSALLSLGVDAIGLDGEYVRQADLLIPQERFVSTDLRQTITLDDRFDLAICLEVAEHLPESRATGLVSDLVKLSSCVLFSAAIPGQGGTAHVNEQYLSYWVERFARFDYSVFDFIRPLIAGAAGVEWWYQQNIVMFAAPSHPVRQSLFPGAMDAVHRVLYEQLIWEFENLPTRRLVSALPRSVAASLRRQLVRRGSQ